MRYGIMYSTYINIHINSHQLLVLRKCNSHVIMLYFAFKNARPRMTRTLFIYRTLFVNNVVVIE